MRYALVVVEKPTKSSGLSQGQWPAFVFDVASIAPKIGDQKRISETTWLLSLPEDTQTFSGLVNLASVRNIPHRVLYFQDAPIEYSFKPLSE
ncbi:MAG: hypothetical protein ACOYNV_17835 [Propionivibrio sp.]